MEPRGHSSSPPSPFTSPPPPRSEIRGGCGAAPNRKLSFFKLFNHSFQVLAILLTTLVYSVVYGYRFWTAIGLPSACVVNCQMALLSCNLVCHFFKGGCNGIGNSVLNGAILLLVLNFYVKMHLRRVKARGGGGVEMVKDRDI
ncbi:hypothetical protein ABFS83_03G018100 [Erythranthe nasuta]